MQRSVLLAICTVLELWLLGRGLPTALRSGPLTIEKLAVSVLLLLVLAGLSTILMELWRGRLEDVTRIDRRRALIGVVASLPILLSVSYWTGDLDRALPAFAGGVDARLWDSNWPAQRRERVDAADLEVGDCLARVAAGGLAERVPCGRMHAFEVVWVAELSGPYRPSQDTDCRRADGAEIRRGVRLTVLWPTPPQWESPVTRWGLCVAHLAGYEPTRSALIATDPP
jgi:hypothetical protein